MAGEWRPQLNFSGAAGHFTRIYIPYYDQNWCIWVASTSRSLSYKFVESSCCRRSQSQCVCAAWIIWLSIVRFSVDTLDNTFAKPLALAFFVILISLAPFFFHWEYIIFIKCFTLQSDTLSAKRNILEKRNGTIIIEASRCGLYRVRVQRVNK